jgi:site-specific DNA recombinase
MGVKAIATYLNNCGEKRRGKTWNIVNVHRTLTNTAYFGEFQYGKNRVRKSPEQQVIIVPIPKIVPKELFLKVQDGLASRRLPNFSNKAERSPSLLTGLLKCGICNCNLLIQTGKSGKYKYYKCRNQMVNGIHSCNCPIIPKEKLEKVIINHLLNNLITEDRIVGIISDLKALLKNLTKGDKRKLSSKKSKHSDLKGKINTLYQLISEQRIELDDTLSEHLRSLKNKSLIQKLEIEELNKRQFLAIRNFGEKQTKLFIQVAKTILNNKSEEAKKAFLSALVTNIIVTRRGINIEGNNFQMASAISQTKMGTINMVPTFVSMWR